VTYSEAEVVDRMAGGESRVWFPQHLHQSAHLRRSLRSLQAVAQENAQERQQRRSSRGNAGQMIHFTSTSCSTIEYAIGYTVAYCS